MKLLPRYVHVFGGETTYILILIRGTIFVRMKYIENRMKTENENPSAICSDVYGLLARNAATLFIIFYIYVLLSFLNH